MMMVDDLIYQSDQVLCNEVEMWPSHQDWWSLLLSFDDDVQLRRDALYRRPFRVTTVLLLIHPDLNLSLHLSLFSI